MAEGIQSTDELDERAERVVEHSRELEELRNKKRDALQKTEVDTEDDSESLFSRFRTTSPLTTGWIRDVKLDERRKKYVVTVDVEKEDGTQRVYCHLDWPKDIDEAHIDNDVIKLAHHVGDSNNLDDILEQKVPMIKKNNKYQLDLPQKTNRRRRFTNWSRRRLVSTGILKYDSGKLSINDKILIGAASLVSIPLFIFGATSLAAILTSFSTLTTGIGATTMAVVFMFFMVLFLSAMFGGSPEHHNDDVGKLPLVIFGGQFALCSIYSIFATPTATGATDGFSSLILFGAGSLGSVIFTVIGLLGILFGLYKFAFPIILKGLGGVKRLHTWSKKQKGIDHLKVEK